MNIYNIVYSGKYLNALEWFFTDDRGPVIVGDPQAQKLKE